MDKQKEIEQLDEAMDKVHKSKLPLWFKNNFTSVIAEKKHKLSNKLKIMDMVTARVIKSNKTVYVYKCRDGLWIDHMNNKYNESELDFLHL